MSDVGRCRLKTNIMNMRGADIFHRVDCFFDYVQINVLASKLLLVTGGLTIKEKQLSIWSYRGQTTLFFFNLILEGLVPFSCNFNRQT
jgi:hypothetical protein